MKYKILAIFMAIMCMGMGTTIVHAGGITASHSIVSAVPAASGTAVTMNISITNNSADTLTNVTIEGTGALAPVDSVAGALQVTYLPAGQSVTVPWSLIVKQYSPQDIFRLLASGFDAAGSPVTIPITSKEAVQ